MRDGKVYVTLQKTKTMGKHNGKDDIFTIRMTQTYMQECDMGHHHWFIQDANGNVLGASGSIGGVPSGKIDYARLDDTMDRFYKDWSFSREVDEKWEGK